MMKAIKENVGPWASGLTIVSVVIGTAFSLYTGLSNQIQKTSEENRASIVAANQRLDTTNQRIDKTYDLILEIIRENKKTAKE